MHYLTLKLPVPKEVSDYAEGLGLTSKQTTAAKIILANSAWSKRVGSGGTVLYSRNANTVFPQEKRKNPLGVSAYQIKSMVDKLSAMGVLETEVGYRSKHEEARECSRFKCTDEILRSIKPVIPKKVFSKVFEEIDRSVIHFDEKVEGVEYKTLDNKEEWDDIIKRIVLNNMSFEWKDHKGHELSFFNMTRIFNNDYLHGGRLYRYDMLAIPNRAKRPDGTSFKLPLNETRIGVKVNGKSLVEVDYCNIHPSILFDLKGLDKTDIISGDFYLNLLPEDKRISENRRLMKVVIMIIINTELYSKARYTCHMEAMKAEYKGITITGHEAFDYAMTLMGHVIDDLFVDKGVGMKLQKIDSDIALTVCDTFASLGKPICPIHDSFLVLEEDCGMLIETMSKTYKDMVGEKTGNYNTTVRLKVKWIDGSNEEIVR